MDPVTISVALTAASTLAGGVASSRVSNYQAAISDVNAKQAELNADLRLEKAQIDVEDRSLQQAALLGSAEARIGASGVGFTSPSVVRTRDICSRHFCRRTRPNHASRSGGGCKFPNSSECVPVRGGVSTIGGKFCVVGKFSQSGFRDQWSTPI